MAGARTTGEEPPGAGGGSGAGREPGEAPAPEPARLGDWLSGPGGGTAVDQPWPGHRLGLPRYGPGSTAPTGRRFLQLLLDLLAAFLAGTLLYGVTGAERNPVTTNLYGTAVFVVEVVVLTVVGGQTIGMRLTRLRLVRLADGGPVRPVGALLRTLLLVLLLPAAIRDPDGRGLHDRAAGAVVVRA